MANEVEITLKVVDEATPAFEKTRQSIEEMAAEFKAWNPELAENKEELTKVVKQLEKWGAASAQVKHILEGTADETEKLSEETKKLGKESKETVKETDKLGKSLLSIGRGVIGVSGLFMLGRAIKGVAEDSLEAAKEAGKLPKIFDEAEESASRLQIAMGVSWAREIEPVVKATTSIKDEVTKTLEDTERINQALDKGVITQEEYVKLYEEYRTFKDREVPILELINEREQERLDLMESIREESETLTHAERQRGEELRRSNFEAAEAAEEALETARELAALTPIDFFADVDVDIASKIRAAIRDIEFVLLGFTETVQQYEDLMELLVDPTVFVSPETVQTMLGDLEEQAELEAIALDYETGEIDLTEAKKEIQDQIGGTLAEAEIILMNIISGLNELDNRRIQIFIDWQGEVPGMPGGAGGGTGGGGGGGGDEPGGVGGGGGGGLPPPMGGDGPSFGIGTIVVQSPGDALDMVDALVEALS